MDGHNRLKAAILSTIIRDTPASFWTDLRGMTRQAYLDVFQQILADPNMVPEQRIDRLRQDRHFRMEHVLKSLSAKYGLACSTTVLSENSQHYVYVTSGDVGITQTYVTSIGELPKPARYRDRLASMNDIPRLDLGDEPPSVLVGKSYYGLVAHNPIGKKFDESDQKLGMIQFCIPTTDGCAWAVELAIEEIVSTYPSSKPEPAPTRKPVWKGRDKKLGEG